MGIFYIQNLPWPVFYKNRDRRISKIPLSPFFILCQILTPAISQLHLLLSVPELPSYRSAVHLSLSMHIQDKFVGVELVASDRLHTNGAMIVTAGIPNPAPIEMNTGYIALKIWNGIK